MMHISNTEMYWIEQSKLQNKTITNSNLISQEWPKEALENYTQHIGN